MPISNNDIADAFNEMADLLDIQGGNPFRVRAYRNAARETRNWPVQFSEVLKRGEELPKIPGIGADLASKMREIAERGSFGGLDEIRRSVAPGLAALLKIPGLGPKRVRLLQTELQIRSLATLEAAARGKRIQELRGFSAESERKILQAIDEQKAREPRGRMNLAVAGQIVGPLLASVSRAPGVERAIVAGSFRRRAETVGDIDILASCRDSAPVMGQFTSDEDVAQVVSRGGTRATVILKNGVQADLRVVPPESYGAALHYFTGSKAHNIAIRAMGIKRGLKVNEYGVFRGRKRIGGRDEEDVFNAVGLPFIEPELRENRGEIEAAREGRLPRLVELSEIRGDLHAHTVETDGRATLEQMAEAACERGYEYLAVTDHSRRLTVASGLTPARLKKQLEAVDRLNDRYRRARRGFRILKSIEVDILEDGSLDLPDDVLALLDLTVCSVHSKFELSEARQTERIIRAMRNPNFRILGHPTGRILGERGPYRIDMEKIVRAARDLGRILELNAQPERMDLADVHCRMARDSGVMIAISTDAHGVNDLDFMKFGVAQARRGWIEAEDVLNTRRRSEILALFSPRRAA